jgi:competence protein ComEA
MSRRTLLDLSLAAAALVAFALLVVRQDVSPGIEIEVRDPSPGIDEIRVDVAGAVRAPQVVVVAPGQRVADAVALAGGLSDDADAAALNLARRVVDEDRVYVPRAGETVAPLLDLNTATSRELQALPGIGPVYAGRIIEAREAARFASSDELVDRQVVPEHVYERIRDLVAAW